MPEQRSTIFTALILAVASAGVVLYFFVRSPQSEQSTSAPEDAQLAADVDETALLPSLLPPPSPFPSPEASPVVAGVQDVASSAETGAADYVVPAAALAIVLGLIGATAIVVGSFW